MNKITCSSAILLILFTMTSLLAGEMGMMSEEQLLKEYGDYTIVCPIQAKQSGHALTVQKGEKGLSIFVKKETFEKAVRGLETTCPTLADVEPAKAKGVTSKVLGVHPNGAEGQVVVLATKNENTGEVGMSEFIITDKDAEKYTAKLDAKRLTLKDALKAPEKADK